MAKTLARVVPGVSLDQGHRFADQIHNTGQAIVWSGQREPAELYWQQLSDAGLTMAPLESSERGAQRARCRLTISPAAIRPVRAASRS